MHPSSQSLRNALCTLMKSRYAHYTLWSFGNAFQAKYVPNHEMTLKKVIRIFGWKMEFFSKKGHWEIKLAKFQT